MSMNGIDYTKKLAKEREYFQDANQKVKEAAEKRIQETEKRAEYITSKQKDTFTKDRADLESAYQSNLDQLKEKSKSSFDTSSQKFNDELNRERQSFTEESNKKRQEFDQRLRDVKSSYQKSFEDQVLRNEMLGKRTKDKYKKNINEVSDNFNHKIEDYENKLRSRAASLGADVSKEREQLVRIQEENLAKLKKDAAFEKDSLKGQLRYENKMKDIAREAEHSQQLKYFEDRFKEDQKKFQTREETLSKDYALRNKKFVEEQHRQTVKTNKEHQEQISDLKRDFNGNLRKIELEKRRHENVSGEFGEFQNDNNVLNERAVSENKIKYLQNELVNAKRDYQARNLEDQASFNATLEKESNEAVALRDKKLSDANSDKLMTISREREKTQREIENRENQGLIAKNNYESQLIMERKNASDRLNRLKENFNNSMKSFEQKHNESLKQVAQTTNADKKEFMKKLEEKRVEEVVEMKRAFEKMLKSTAYEYEQRLAGSEREIELLNVTMDQKIQMIQDKNKNEFDSQRMLFEDRHNEGIRNQQMILDDKEYQLRQTITDLNSHYQKKIDKMQIEGESNLKLITDNYETRLRNLNIENKKEMLQRQNAHSREIMQLKKTYEDEKMKMAKSHESQIENIQKGHREQMNQVSQFKKLS